MSVLVFCGLVCGCGGSGSDEESASNRSKFYKPFEGDYTNTWPFDHQYPTGPFHEDCDIIAESNALTWRGELLELHWDTRCHDGYDWAMPEGVPLLAVADGKVVFADAEEPFQCHDKGEVAALIVRIRHTFEDGREYETTYAHLSQIDVEVGEWVTAQQPIGLSGATGCVTGPHLHFAVYRLDETNDGNKAAVDPFGWAGDEDDPWAIYSRGAESHFLWLPGQAPSGDYGEIFFKP